MDRGLSGSGRAPRALEGFDELRGASGGSPRRPRTRASRRSLAGETGDPSPCDLTASSCTIGISSSPLERRRPPTLTPGGRFFRRCARPPPSGTAESWQPECAEGRASTSTSAGASEGEKAGSPRDKAAGSLRVATVRPVSSSVAAAGGWDAGCAAGFGRRCLSCRQHRKDDHSSSRTPTAPIASRTSSAVASASRVCGVCSRGEAGGSTCPRELIGRGAGVGG